jgi:methyl-accepting chemotaxis protein
MAKLTGFFKRQKKGPTHSNVMAKRIVTLCLSLTLSISIIYTVVNLINLSTITNRNLKNTAELDMKYLNESVQHALLPAIDLTNSIAAMVPKVESYVELENIFVAMMPTVSSVFEMYFGTLASRFEGGSFITATDWEPYTTNPQWDQIRRPWFIFGIQNPRKTMITDPYEDSSTGEMCVSIVRTVESGGQITGVVGTDVFLSELTRIITSNKITSDGNTFIINKEGMYLVHQDSSLVMTANFFETAERGLQNIGTSAGIGVLINGTTYWTSVAVPGLEWYIISTGSTDEYTRDFWGALTVIIIMAVALAAAASVISLIFGKILTKPIIKLFDVLEAIAAGDLTQEIEIKGKDEIAHMTLMLKETQESLRALISEISSRARNLEDVAEELSKIMNKSATALNHISTSTQGMSEKSISQSASVTETIATMAQIVKNIESLNQHIETQAVSVSRSSSEIDKMIRQTTAVTQALVQNEKNVENLAAASGEGYTKVQKVSNDISTVTHESEKLLEINQVIQRIASQTNLLAMNAAIEAAHAGEVGRGFAVVADEIRKLAVSSSGQAKTVSEVLKTIKGALDSISNASGAVLTGFAVIDDAVKTVTEQENNIRDTMETQDAGSKEILQNMQSSQDITEKVRRSSGEMLTGSREVIGEGRRLESITGELTNGMKGIVEDIVLLKTTISRADAISRENTESINVLLDEISRFKIG